MVTTVVIAMALLGQTLGSTIYGELRTPPEVRAQLAQQGSADIVVHLNFTPEDFNLNYLQDHGVIVRSSGRTIYMRFVGPDDVRSIAGQYWVAGIDAWNAD